MFFVTNPKFDFIAATLATVEILVFLTGIGIRINCLLKVHSTFDNDDLA